MKILVIDNYDSFTYNLVYIFRKYSKNVDVYRNDKITPEQCMDYDAIVLSPGPGIPVDAGNMIKIIDKCISKIPILGICLGHQALGEYLGAKLINMAEVYHGVQTNILVKKQVGILKQMEKEFLAGRYHSWNIDTNTLNDKIEVTATDENNSIMAIQNTELKIYGVQFHPESVLTPEGEKIVKAFISLIK